MKSIGYIIAIIIAVFACVGGAALSIFGFLYILGSGSQSGSASWLPTGILLLIIGIILLIVAAVLAFLIFRRAKKDKESEGKVTYKVELPGSVSLSQIKCQSCGGVLSSDNITMVAGAPVVNCPYCHTTYQLSEEPKW
ncbi:MAG: hypothetical protein HPY45_07970 [Anaerolineae bacterium]|nr:hypothetical protein [Anaerolineae bacterium]